MSVEHFKIQSQETFNNGLNLQLPKHTATKNPAEQNIKEQHKSGAEPDKAGTTIFNQGSVIFPVFLSFNSANYEVSLKKWCLHFWRLLFILKNLRDIPFLLS